MKRNLATFKLDETGIIDSIEDGALSLKLMEMGCMPGEQVRLSSVAPTGDPIAIEVSGYTLSLRKADAERILIKY